MRTLTLAATVSLVATLAFAQDDRNELFIARLEQRGGIGGRRAIVPSRDRAAP